MARTYRRDARGRFAGGGGGSGGRRGAKLPAPAARKVGSAPQRRRGLLTQRAAVKAAKGKLAAKDPADRSIKGTLSRRSQKGAVTKASKALQAAQQGGRVRLSGRSGVLRPGRKTASVVAAAKPAVRGSTRIRVQTLGSKARTLRVKADAANKEAGKYQWNQQPYNPKNFFGMTEERRSANMAKADAATLGRYKAAQQEFDRWNRRRSKTAKAATETGNAAFYAQRERAKRQPGVISGPRATRRRRS